MIKTIRHLWVACARALRLTTVVKRAAIRGFTRMSESSVCATARPARGNVITPGYDANIVSNESTTDNRICTYCSPFLFFFLLLLFSLERHIFDGKPPVLHSSQVGQLCAHLAVLKDSLYYTMSIWLQESGETGMSKFEHFSEFSLESKTQWWTVKPTCQPIRIIFLRPVWISCRILRQFNLWTLNEFWKYH